MPYPVYRQRYGIFPLHSHHLFRFLLVLPCCPLCFSAFFFPVFLLKKLCEAKRAKNNRKQGNRESERNKIVQLQKQKRMNIIGRITADANVHTLKDARQVVNFSSRCHGFVTRCRGFVIRDSNNSVKIDEIIDVEVIL